LTELSSSKVCNLKEKKKGALVNDLLQYHDGSSEKNKTYDYIVKI